LRSAIRIWIHECDHFDVGVVLVRSDIQVVDATETDEGGSDGAVVGYEGHQIARIPWSGGHLREKGSGIEHNRSDGRFRSSSDNPRSNGGPASRNGARQGAEGSGRQVGPHGDLTMLTGRRVGRGVEAQVAW
jgi:hypothetical protein